MALGEQALEKKEKKQMLGLVVAVEVKMEG
jgi:hypothetical protein